MSFFTPKVKLEIGTFDLHEVDKVKVFYRKPDELFYKELICKAKKNNKYTVTLDETFPVEFYIEAHDFSALEPTRIGSPFNPLIATESFQRQF